MIRDAIPTPEDGEQALNLEGYLDATYGHPPGRDLTAYVEGHAAGVAARVRHQIESKIEPNLRH